MVVGAEYYEFLDPATAKLKLETTNEGPWICSECGQLVESKYDTQRYNILDLYRFQCAQGGKNRSR